MLKHEIRRIPDFELVDDYLHDAVFVNEDIHYDQQARSFSLSCWRMLEEPASRKRLLPFIYVERHKWARCRLTRNKVTGIDLKVTDGSLQQHMIIKVVGRLAGFSL